MKLITLNIRHGGGKRVPQILGYLQSRNPDVIALTEFRENSNAIALRAGLAESGFLFFAGASTVAKENSVYIIGDVNTGLHFQDEERASFYCTQEFEALIESGLVDSWRSRNPKTIEFSWYSNHGNGFRIDHVFSSRQADVNIQRVYYDHTPREEGITDHSALVVESVS